MTDFEEREWRGLNRFDATAWMDEADQCSPAVLRRFTSSGSGHGRRAAVPIPEEAIRRWSKLRTRGAMEEGRN